MQKSYYAFYYHFEDFEVVSQNPTDPFPYALNSSSPWQGVANNNGTATTYTTTTTSGPIYQISVNGKELQIAGLGHQEYKLEYTIDSSTHPLLSAGDSAELSTWVTMDGSFTNPRVQVIDQNGLVIYSRSLTVQNNIYQTVQLNFRIPNGQSSVKVVFSTKYSQVNSYAPNLVNGGVSNWSNGIYVTNLNCILHNNKGTIVEQYQNTIAFNHTDHYRYGFNGQERDNEIYGNGNSTTATFWQYDARLGRRWNVDPKPNPSISPYATFANNPIFWTDHKGDTLDEQSQEVVNDLKVEITNKINDYNEQIGGLEKRKNLSQAQRLYLIYLKESVAELKASLEEIDVIESSEQWYSVVNEGVDGEGLITYNPTSINPDNSVGTIKLYYSNSASLTHELKHAYQYEMKELSFHQGPRVEWNGGLLYDAKDEIEAYRRTAAFGLNYVNNINGRLNITVNTLGDINYAFIQNIVNPNGKSTYAGLSPFSLTSSTPALYMLSANVNRAFIQGMSVRYYPNKTNDNFGSRIVTNLSNYPNVRNLSSGEFMLLVFPSKSKFKN